MVCLQAQEGGFLDGHNSLGVRTLESKSVVRLENVTQCHLHLPMCLSLGTGVELRQLVSVGCSGCFLPRLCHNPRTLSHRAEKVTICPHLPSAVRAQLSAACKGLSGQLSSGPRSWVCVFLICLSLTLTPLCLALFHIYPQASPLPATPNM